MPALRVAAFSRSPSSDGAAMRAGWIIHALAALAAASLGRADILATNASVRPNNSLIVDIDVLTSGSAARVVVAYEALPVEPLVSSPAPVSTAGRATITIGRLRANTTYQYTVSALDDSGAPAGNAMGTFTTGALPRALTMATFTLTGRTTVPLVILPLAVSAAPEASGGDSFRGYVALDLHAPDAPQIVWYYSNAPSAVAGVPQVDAAVAIEQEQNGNLLFADAGSGPAPNAADSFYREITPDGGLVAESPADCSVTPPPASPNPRGWIWGQGNDVPELLPPGADGVPGTVLHLGKVVKDPFFDAGLAPQGTRLQLGATIRRWDPGAGTDKVIWDAFRFLDPLRERTEAASSDPAANSSNRGLMACAGASLLAEDWMHANSLQVTPAGMLLMSVRHLDTVIAISPQLDRIAWRIGGPSSDFAFLNPGDRFYHQHFARMLDNGNLLLMDNGNGRPAAEGGQYTRALELALDWDAMTATNVWEYSHGSEDKHGVLAYKYSDKVGSAQRLQNGNTLVLFGADIDLETQLPRLPQTLTLVEAGASAAASPLAVLDMSFPGNFPIYRALPAATLFGESAARSGI